MFLHSLLIQLMTCVKKDELDNYNFNHIRLLYKKNNNIEIGHVIGLYHNSLFILPLFTLTSLITIFHVFHLISNSFRVHANSFYLFI